jgi:error-prone DNA polymerase
MMRQHSDAETCNTVDPGFRWDDERQALRLGLRQIKGLAEADAERLVMARGAGYRDARDLWHRSGLGRAALERLAEADALRSLDQSHGGLDRRRGLWALKALGEAPLPLFANLNRHPGEGRGPLGHVTAASSMAPGLRRGDKKNQKETETETFAASLLPEMPLGEHVVEDYASLGLTIKRHPLAFLRAELREEGLAAAADLATLPVDRRLAIAGLVLIRQRPGSANGVVFITLEDETGIANLIVWPAVLERFRRAALGATLLYCRGRLQREESVIHVVAEDLRDMTARLNTLRDRTGDNPPPDARKRPFALRERIPGYDPRDLAVTSRDFR